MRGMLENEKNLFVKLILFFFLQPPPVISGKAPPWVPVADGLEVLDADDLAERPPGDQLLRPQGGGGAGGGREMGKAGEGREVSELRVGEEGVSRSEGGSPPPLCKHPCVEGACSRGGGLQSHSVDPPQTIHLYLPAPLGIARV